MWIISLMNFHQVIPGSCLVRGPWVIQERFFPTCGSIGESGWHCEQRLVCEAVTGAKKLACAVQEYFQVDAPDKFHEGWLITGDVAKIDEEGAIVISDRSKDVLLLALGW